MTLLEVCLILSVVGSAVVGLVAGYPNGIAYSVLGFLLGPLIGLIAFATMVGIPGFLITRTNPESGPRATPLQNALAAMIFVGMVGSAPVGWAATISVIRSLADWMSA